MLSISRGGKGIFVLTDIPVFTFISEYAGEIVDDTDGKAMMLAGKDTHLLTLSSKLNSVYGSVHGQLTEDYYCRHHKMGAFANASKASAGRNCKYFYLDVPARFAYSTNYEKRIFFSNN
jgi:hypothetical protein